MTEPSTTENEPATTEHPTTEAPTEEAGEGYINPFTGERRIRITQEQDLMP